MSPSTPSDPGAPGASDADSGHRAPAGSIGLAGVDATVIEPVLRRSFPEWPAGTPKARILAQYLTGRAGGLLDLSGRPAVPGAADGEEWVPLPWLVVGDDEDGALAWVCAAVEPTAEVWTAHDSLIDERRARGTGLPPGARAVDLLEGPPEGFPAEVRAVIAAPKAVAALDEFLVNWPDRCREIIVVGRDKHMSTAINTSLDARCGRVDVSPGMGKSRMIIGSALRNSGPGEGRSDDASPRFPRTSRVVAPVPGVPDLVVAAHGACFGGAGADAGSALLLTALADHLDVVREAAAASSVASSSAPRMASDADDSLAPVRRSVLDMGCGNGWLLRAAAALIDGDLAGGVDVSRAALASTRATFAASPGGPELRLALADAADPGVAADPATATHPADAADPSADGDDGLLARGSQGLILLNPPFHSGHAVETRTAGAMIAATRRVLAPGGLLVCVFNSHLRYRGRIDAVFGGSQQWARDRRFTVVAARVPAGSGVPVDAGVPADA